MSTNDSRSRAYRVIFGNVGVNLKGGMAVPDLSLHVCPFDHELLLELVVTGGIKHNHMLTAFLDLS